MKLSTALHPDWRAQLDSAKATLTKVLSDYETELAAIGKLRQTALELPPVIAQIEAAAQAGTDAEAAIQLAGRREQQRLLTLNIEERERVIAQRFFPEIRQAALRGIEMHRMTCRELVEPHLETLTKMLTPHFEFEWAARQWAISIPSSQYMLGLCNEHYAVAINDWESALSQAQDAAAKIDDILAGRDIFPDYSETVAKAKEARELNSSAISSRHKKAAWL